MEKIITASKERLQEKIQEMVSDDSNVNKKHTFYKNRLSIKLNQYEIDLKKFKDSELENEERVIELEKIKEDGEELLEWIIFELDQQKEEQERMEKERERERMEKERERIEREKELEIEKKRLEVHLQERKIEMEEKLTLEKMQVECIKIETEGKCSEQSKSNKTMSVRLPKLEIKKFDGYIMKWREFWDCFESAINENTNLSDIDKFNYLRAQLTGRAMDVISGLELTNKNYSIAIQLLKERYGKDQRIIDAHHAQLMNMPTVSNQTSSLRSFYDTMERHLRTLSSLGEEINNKFLLSAIRS